MNLEAPNTGNFTPKGFRLKVPSLKVNAGKLTVICGPAGSGKSSLLYSFFGEMSRSENTYPVDNLADNPTIAIDEKVTFIEQIPFILHTTL